MAYRLTAASAAGRLSATKPSCAENSLRPSMNPERTTLGPISAPDSTPRRVTSSVASVFPMSRTLVTPAARWSGPSQVP